MGASIYLVSACTSGEEFIAAFRRYADKNGLFIPIGDPLPPGSRGRFAVTLRDGGVMIEGEAEIVSSARTPSVLHGRVGMTLRFVEPDDASRTTLGELERARLSMRPPPPSVPPRPADLPAEPRPVPPPVQGRIDAVNALAECVAIGDVAALGPPLPPVTSAPPRATPRSTMPATAAGGRSAPGTRSSDGLGLAQPAAAPRSSAAPPPMAMTGPDVRGAPAHDTEPPAVIPRATPQPDRLRGAERRPGAAAPDSISGLSRTMTAVAVAPGPTSDTIVAATPPAPPAAGASEPPGRVEDGPISATLTAVPVPGATSPSAPTEIGGALVVPIDPDEDPSARTQIHAGAPVPPASATAPPAPPPSGGPRRSSELRTNGIVPITVSGMPPTRPPAPPLSIEVEIAEPTDISMPPEPPSSPSARLAAEAGPSTEPEAAVLSGETVPSTEPEVAALASGAISSVEPERATGRQDAADPRDSEQSGAVTDELAAEAEPAASPGRPRRTVIGVAVVPSGVLVPPAPPAPPARRAPSPTLDDEETHGRILLGDGRVHAGAPTAPPRSDLLVAADEPTLHRAWPPDSDELAAERPPPPEPEPAPAPAPPPPPGTGNGLPSGDWTIALDPSAPDGWSSPLQTAPPHQVKAGAPPPSPPARPSPPPVTPGAPVVHVRTPPMSPLAMAMTSAEPADPEDAVPVHAVRPGEIAAVEPKVQIDPTLIEPHHAVAPDRAAAMASPGIAAQLAPEIGMYGTGPAVEAVEAPALHGMMAMPQPGPFAASPPQALHGGQVPAYALDPGYPMMAMQPGLVTADGSGFGDPRYPGASAPSLQARRRGLVIVLVTAVAAVLLGIGAMLVFRGGASDAPAPGVPPRAPAQPAASVERTAPPAPPAAGSSDTAAPGAPAPAAPGAGGSAAAAAAPPPPPASECFANVVSQPAGADIVLDQSQVIGTTPQRVALPCGSPVELVIRKGRLVPVTRTVTPTPDGAPVHAVLVRQTVLVKVSSTPAGATVMLGGKTLGVTPTMVKVPAFESSLLSIAKDGYETETEKVAPRGNGTAVHSVLKKLDHRKPR